MLVDAEAADWPAHSTLDAQIITTCGEQTAFPFGQGPLSRAVACVAQVHVDPLPLLQLTLIAAMTTYIPSLTLPNFVFENPAVSILLPLVCGTATGFAISRKFSSSRCSCEDA